MSTYLSAAALAAEAPTRLAQATSPEAGPVLDAAILTAQLAGADLVALGYEASAIAAAAGAAAHIEGAIARAESTLEAAVRLRYALPLAPLDALVVGIVRDLAWGAVYRAGMPPEVTAAADRARADLGRIQRGELRLSAAALGSGAGAGAPEWSTPGAPWSDADLEDLR